YLLERRTAPIVFDNPPAFSLALWLQTVVDVVEHVLVGADDLLLCYGEADAPRCPLTRVRRAHGSLASRMLSLYRLPNVIVRQAHLLPKRELARHVHCVHVG